MVLIFHLNTEKNGIVFIVSNNALIWILEPVLIPDVGYNACDGNIENPPLSLLQGGIHIHAFTYSFTLG